MSKRSRKILPRAAACRFPGPDRAAPTPPRGAEPVAAFVYARRIDRYLADGGFAMVIVIAAIGVLALATAVFSKVTRSQVRASAVAVETAVRDCASPRQRLLWAVDPRPLFSRRRA